MRNIFVCVFCVVSLLITACSPKVIVIEDFESDSFGGWLVEGDAFGQSPAAGPVDGQQEVKNFSGGKFANSFHGGDNSQGVLTSSEFVIEGNFINFLIGGGKQEGTYVELLVEDESIYVSRALEESESLHWVSWDVKAYAGKTARIKIVDQQEGGWGHILVDQIETGNKAKSEIVTDYTLSFAINQKYLLIPVEDLAPESQVIIRVDGQEVKPGFNIRLAQGQIDYWVPMDVEQYKGQTIELLIPYIKKEALALSKINPSDSFDYEYDEKHRPAYHFSQPYGWINDPNGMVYYDGEYHLFYQHNPFGKRWENMSWGHAVSTDLVNWEHLPIALLPDTLGGIFSGSAVVDWNNTAGFQTGEEKTLLAFFTHGNGPLGQCQSLAYSNDKGRTWTKYENNPILTKEATPDFRDPKVFWYAPSKKWIQLLAVGQVMEIYSSTDAINWKYESEFGEGYGAHGGVWECPDLFELPVEGMPGVSKWVLICNLNPGGPSGGSAAQYFIGSFDGKTFKCEDKSEKIRWMDWGKDHYATVSWSDAPRNATERTVIAWMSNWEYANEVPTQNFRNTLSIPRTVTLAKTKDGDLVLKSYPVVETESLRKEAKKIDSFSVKEEHTIDQLLADNQGAYELMFTIENGKSEVLGFKLFNNVGECVDVSLNFSEKKMYMDRKHSGLTDFSSNFPAITSADCIKKDNYTFRVLIDKASIELFESGGEVAMTNMIFPTEPYNRISFYTKGGEFTVPDLTIYNLK